MLGRDDQREAAVSAGEGQQRIGLRQGPAERRGGDANVLLRPGGQALRRRWRGQGHVAAGTAGLDTCGEAVSYIASWADQEQLELVGAAAALIDSIARRLEDAIGAHGRAAEAVAA